MAPKYVLTLVHGTWADADGWVADGSFLRRELERRLAHTAFREFWWSGTNRHAARTEGGLRLVEFIQAGHAEHPQARHFIVAHSHGGNVALYAMRSPNARLVIDGVITLATPFLCARRREPTRHMDVVAWIALVVTALWAFVILDALALHALALWWVAASAACVVKAKPTLARWLTETVRLEQEAILAAVHPPRIDRAKLLVLCARGDEARRWLRAWEVIAQGPFVIGCVLLAVVDFALRSNIPALVDGLAQRMFDTGFNQISWLDAEASTAWSMVLMLCSAWAAALIASSLLRWPGYWREPLLANAFVDMRTNPTPDPTAEEAHIAHTFDIAGQCALGHLVRKGLRHSAICSHPLIASAIADWIAAGRRPARPRTTGERDE